MKNISLFLISLFCPTIVFAATATTAALPNSTPTPTPVQYDLPYPGMLPNSPLYFLKQTRDWILDKLIVDPVKKTEFYILQGDKRLAMGIQLSASGNPVLAEQVISKGEKYMNSGVQSLLSLKTQEKEAPAYLVDHMNQALAKHEEVLTDLIAKTSDAAIQTGLTGSLHLVSTLRSEVQ